MSVRIGEDNGGVWLARVFVPAAHNKFNHLVPVEGVFVIHYAEGSEAPVDCVHAQMGRHMVCEVIFTLEGFCQLSVWARVYRLVYITKGLNICDMAI